MRQKEKLLTQGYEKARLLFARIDDAPCDCPKKQREGRRRKQQIIHGRRRKIRDKPRKVVVLASANEL